VSIVRTDTCDGISRKSKACAGMVEASSDKGNQTAQSWTKGRWPRACY